MSALYPLRLAPSWREKIWGSTNLEPVFGATDRKIGEVWFTFEENTIANGPCAGETVANLMTEHGHALMGTMCTSFLITASQTAARPYFPILTKFLFTSDKLSVQVHPDDRYAFEHEGGPGKTEMWYVLRADPGATIALGLTEAFTKEELRKLAASGDIARYLNWVEVETGEAIFTPPGTLHSIGPGLALFEVQQNSDLTYRFYDFGRRGDDGRERPLHIDRAVEVTQLVAHPGPEEAAPFRRGDLDGETLVVCDYFAVERLHAASALKYEPDPERMHLLAVTRGRGHFGGEPYEPGNVYMIPAALAPFEWHPAERTEVLRAYVP